MTSGPDAQAPIPVEVAYATPEKQLIIPLAVQRGTTALEAVQQSGIAQEFPGLDLERQAMGIFAALLNGRDLPAPAEYVLEPYDRVEIYRPLQIDPKQARLARARNKAKQDS